MKISVKVDYACRVLAEMARLHGSGELAQIEQLARVEAVPASSPDPCSRAISASTRQA